MIEYLDEEFNLHVIDGELSSVPESWILVPEGAEIFASSKNKKTKFYKDDFTKFYNNNTKGKWLGSNSLLTHGRGFKILWQREDESIVNAEFFGEGKKIRTVDETLNERQSEYGCFEDVAFVTENVIGILKRCGYENMPNPHKMAMYMIVSKMARLVNGDHNHLDSWHDIGGYSKLIENLIGGENE